jgi:dienelactone hydrolase
MGKASHLDSFGDSGLSRVRTRGNAAQRKKQTMKDIEWRAALLAGCVLSAAMSHAQTTMLPSIIETLATPVQPAAVTQYQLEQYLMQRIPGLPALSTAQQWTGEEDRLRRHILNDVVYHGWPREWIDSAPHFEEVGVIETGHGYRIRKLRYEIVPGFLSTALLYEPEKISGRVPAILNLIGHEPEGTAVEYEQKRCINFAKRGIVALNLGWMEFGELSQPENAHDNAAALDLVGSNAIGLFYLAMKRGLDYLAVSPHVDSSRIGATGLSGGGWQTVVLSALDPRIAVSVEVAGLGSRESNLTNPRDTYEIEEDAPDLMQGFDYPTFIAMRAPRPSLLVHNAVDSCCFRAPLVKPYLYDAVKPFFAAYGVPDNLSWHENFDPGVHNYQLDNRNQAYRFFSEHCHLPSAESEIFSDAEIHSAQELAVSLPPGNETILGLAKNFAARNERAPIPTAGDKRLAWERSERSQLGSVVRYKPVSVLRALRMANSKGMGFQSLSYRFDFSNGLSATGIGFKQDSSPDSEPLAIVLDDKGYKAAGQQVFDSLSSGREVFALDLLFNGASRPEVPDSSDWELLVDSSGDRSLGLEAAQLLSIVHWLRATHGSAQITVKTNGIRNQVIALVAAAMEPDAVSGLDVEGGMKSLAYLLEKPVPLRTAPDLFCLDLYKDFDINALSALAPLVKTTQTNPVGR